MASWTSMLKPALTKMFFKAPSAMRDRADGNTRKVQPAHTAGPYRAQGASTTGGSSVNGVPANSQPLKWNERL